MATNAAIAILVASMIWLIGIGPFLLVHLPITLLAASVGVWLFYVQHQFEDTFWDEDEAWNLQAAALHGSSHYDLPGVLRWFTANIGVHHVHHLSSRIPYYRLPRGVARPPAACRRRAAYAASRAFAACAWCCGTRAGGASFPSKRWPIDTAAIGRRRAFRRKRLERNGDNAVTCRVKGRRRGQCCSTPPDAIVPREVHPPAADAVPVGST